MVSIGYHFIKHTNLLRSYTKSMDSGRFHEDALCQRSRPPAVLEESSSRRRLNLRHFNMVVQDVDTAEGDHVDLLRDFVLLLLEGGLVLENTRSEDEFAPLVMAVEGLSSCPTPALLNIISDLLRFGSPMDAIVFFPEAKPIEFLAARFEQMKEMNPPLAQNEHWVNCKKLFAAVRAAGTTWIAYRRVQRKRVLRMRSLMVRGRALPRRTRGSDPIVAPIFRLPNELCWHVLQFWRATCDATGEVI